MTRRGRPNGLELRCPAEAGNAPLLYARPTGDSSTPESAARRVSFSELFGAEPGRLQYGRLLGGNVDEEPGIGRCGLRSVVRENGNLAEARGGEHQQDLVAKVESLE